MLGEEQSHVNVKVHIFEKPAYTVLLGRPFDTLTESKIQNLQDGSAIITIWDPNTKQRTALPTTESGKVSKTEPIGRRQNFKSQDLVNDQGEIAVSFEETEAGEVVLTGNAVQDSGFIKDELRDVYLQAFTTSKGCEGKDEETLSAYFNVQLPQIPRELEGFLQQQESPRSEAGVGEAAQGFGKYKVKPVL
ncbi:hypothetical protein C0989_004292 [Termitomyces sp. Mn162]|nr:hypothetical protein C0989_004292 [Termitomyces sp. Mn162]